MRKRRGKRGGRSRGGGEDLLGVHWYAAHRKCYRIQVTDEILYHRLTKWPYLVSWCESYKGMTTDAVKPEGVAQCRSRLCTVTANWHLPENWSLFVHTVFGACDVNQHDRFGHRWKMTGGSETSRAPDTDRENRPWFSGSQVPGVATVCHQLLHVKPSDQSRSPTTDITEAQDVFFTVY